MYKYWYAIFTACIFQFIVSGCNEPQVPSEKQSRLIATENMELHKELKQRDVAIETLKVQHSKELEEQKKQLAKAQDVLGTVIQQNAELRKEIENLKKQISMQQTQISQLEKMLAEKSK